MYETMLSLAALVPAGALAQLDIAGYVTSTEFLSVIAGLLATFFSGLANALIGNLFGGGA